MKVQEIQITPCMDCKNGKHKKCAYKQQCFDDIELGNGLRYFEEREERNK